MKEDAVLSSSDFLRLKDSWGTLILRIKLAT